MERIQRSIYLNREKFNLLDAYAKKIGISRNQLMENLIESGLEDLKLMEKTGLLLIGVGINDLIQKLRNSGNRQENMEF